MNRTNLVKQIESYCPYSEQERTGHQMILKHLKGEEDIFSRESCLAHMTTLVWVVNSGRTRVLIVYRNIYGSWSWLGGRADSEQDLLQVAVKEVKKKNRFARVRPVSEDIYSLEILTVDGYEKWGTYMGSHLHLNVTCPLGADENDALFSKADENSRVVWSGLENSLKAFSEPWIRQQIYTELGRRLKKQG